MRTRTTVLVVAILLVAGFAALNWSEIVRPTSLSFGAFVMDAPLGLILLGLLALTLVLFLAATAAMRTQSLMDYRQHQKTLEAQRELAEKAEASRFLDLRQSLDAHLREMKERDAIAASEYDKAMVQTQRELRTQIDGINRVMQARLSELEHRLESRLERLVAGGAPLARPAVAPGAAAAADAQAQRLREEERLREERLRAERDLNRDVRQDAQRAEIREERREEKAAAADRPADSGWRRWF